MAASRPDRARAAAWVIGALVALAYPLPFEAGGYVYYETVGFLVLLNALLGIGWNIIGGWAGQFDFGPNIFFAIGAYMYALMASPHLSEAFPWFAQMFPNGLHTPIWLIDR